MHQTQGCAVSHWRPLLLGWLAETCLIHLSLLLWGPSAAVRQLQRLQQALWLSWKLEAEGGWLLRWWKQMRQAEK